MFPFCKAGSLCSSCALYAVSCSSGNQVPGLAGNQPRRALVWGVCFVQRFRVYPSPPPPGGAGKTGRLSGDGPCATTHSLLRLPAKHRPDRYSTQVQRTFIALETHGACVLRVFCAHSPQHVLGMWCLSVRFSRLSKGIPCIIWVTCI